MPLRSVCRKSPVKAGLFCFCDIIETVMKMIVPQFLADELKEFIDKMYKIKPDERLFYTTKFSLLRALHKYGDKAGLSRLRVHDLRHSHISMLINLGYSAVSIAERVGHSSIAITYRYSHMFPTVQKDMANTFEKLNEKIG